MLFPKLKFQPHHSVRLFCYNKGAKSRQGGSYMNYTQLTKEKKSQIDILLDQGLSMRKTAEILGISHSTISRYKANIYKKREVDINKKYDTFLRYLYSHYDYKTCSIEICVI